MVKEAFLGIEYPKIVTNSKSAYHLFTIWVDKNKRDFMLQKFGESGIGVAVNYRAIHLLTYFRKYFGFKRGDFPIAEEIGDRTITLPFYHKLKFEQIYYIIKQVKEVVKKQHRHLKS